MPQAPQCPTPAEVRRATDGVLSSAEHRRISKHVRKCAACRNRRRWLGVWGHDQEESTRCRQLRALRAWLRGCVVLAGLTLVFLLVCSPSAPQTVRAQVDELLDRVAAHELMGTTTPALSVRVRVRLSASQTAGAGRPVQSTGDWTAAAPGLSGPLPVIPASLRRAMRAVHVDVQHFDIFAFRRWRDSVHGRDELISLGNTGLVQVRTTTNEGVLRLAEVTLQKGTYRLVHEMFDFGSFGRLEMEEELPPSAAGAALSRSSASTSSSSSTATLRNDALDLPELQARVVVGAAGLDMRGHVRVFRSNGAVRVDGIVPHETPTRAARQQLAALPNVKVTLRRIPNARVNEGPADAPAAAPGVARWAADPAFTTDSTHRAVVPALGRQIETIRRRLDIFRDLAARYSEAEVRMLSSNARDTFRQLLDLHYQALNGEMQQLNDRMAMICATASRARPASHAPSDWRSRTAVGRLQATALDTLIRELLVRDDLSPTLQHRLAETFGTLWDALQ